MKQWMKNIVGIYLLLLSSTGLMAQEMPPFAIDPDDPYSKMLTDEQGNILILAPLNAAQQEPEKETEYAAMVLSKYANNGDLQWQRLLNIPGMVLSFSGITLTTAQDIYLEGTFRRSQNAASTQALWETDPTSISDTNRYFPLLVKLSPQGTCLWAMTIVNSLQTDQPARAWSVSIDKHANIYFIGFLKKSYRWQENRQTQYYQSTDTDLYMLKYDSNKKLRWAYGISGLAVNDIRAISIDSNDQIYLSGFTTTSKKNPSDTQNSQIYIQEYHLNGILNWVVGSDSQSKTLDVKHLNQLCYQHTDQEFFMTYTDNGQLQWAFGINPVESEFDAIEESSMLTKDFFKDTTSFSFDNEGNKMALKHDMYMLKQHQQGYFIWASRLPKEKSQTETMEEFQPQIEARQVGDDFIIEPEKPAVIENLMAKISKPSQYLVFQSKQKASENQWTIDYQDVPALLTEHQIILECTNLPKAWESTHSFEPDGQQKTEKQQIAIIMQTIALNPYQDIDSKTQDSRILQTDSLWNGLHYYAIPLD